MFHHRLQQPTNGAVATAVISRERMNKLIVKKINKSKERKIIKLNSKKNKNKKQKQKQKQNKKRHLKGVRQLYPFCVLSIEKVTAPFALLIGGERCKVCLRVFVLYCVCSLV